MSIRRAHGRHRAVPVHTSALAVLTKSVTDNAGGVGRQAAVIAAASGLVLTSGVAAQAADAPTQREAEPASTLEVASQVQAPLSADSTVQISYERPVVKTTPAPVIEAPTPVAVQAPKAAVPAATAVANAAAPAKAQVTVTPAPAAAPAAAPAGGVNATMVSSAYAQIGMIQDCTRLVENALNAAGIPVGDLGPMQFMNYGTVVSDPQPGDMVMQPGHVGIYVGNGQVLSSGLNGKNETAVHPLTWMTSKGAVTFVRAG
ncbi:MULTISPECIES: NlpC/P60 family protein [Pseudarthrobacter]|jgi:cell wall-associated NlpC family hydrolase|uniref:NlpC/P60 family protein n=1 Tax=Pseudarthrobacter TaxID=1742993 RepID=UPI00344F13F0